MTKSVRLEWTSPAPYNGLERSNYPGFYCITTVYKGQPSKLLYIGYSYDGTIKSRLSDHNSGWFDKYRGIRISFARILPELHKELSEEDVKSIENAMIYAYNPYENTQGKNNLKGEFAYHRFIIKNCGNIPYGFSPTLDMTELLHNPKLNIQASKPRKSVTKNKSRRLFRRIAKGLLK